jgi:pyrroloquinoline quinone (PQQ) biosynthesis protein C
MWDDFAEALGCDRATLESGTPNAATGALLASGDELVAAGRGAEVLWALESQAPAVSEAKLAGLREHYAMDGGAGTRYFEVHTTMDIRHTRELESLLTSAAGAEPAGPAAERVLAGLYGLLSSVEREAVTA